MTLLLAMPALVTAADDSQQASHTIESIEYSSIPGNKIEIKLSVSGTTPLAEPLSFTIDNPARIAMDFKGTSSEVAKSQTIGLGVARSINVIEAKGRTRVVLNLDRLVPYTTSVADNHVSIILDSEVPQMASIMPPAVASPEAKAERMQEASASGHMINKIDFRRGKKGEGRVVVTLSDAAAQINIDEQAGKIVIDFINTQLPEELVQSLDVIDFATPVNTVDSFNEGRNAQMVIRAQGAFEHLAYQSNEVLTLEVKPLTKEEEEAARKESLIFTGERLSLNFQDIEVRAVLQLIADFTGLNMVTSDTVGGSVTLRLQNVPWDHALDIILKSKGLAMRRTDNVILVAPSEEIAAREKQEFESQKQIEELAPLHTDMIQVNYAKASDLAELLSNEANSIISERGSVTLDERTNTLLVKETADKLEDVRSLVTRLDIPVRQVLIESRVVIANDDFSRDLGVRFGATGVQDNDTNGIIGVSGSLSGTDAMVASAPLPVNTPSLNNRLNTNLPVVGPMGQIAFAVLGSDYLVDLELSAMQTEGRGEVISSPRVITANQSEAVIKQGVEIPYQEASSSGATTVSFREAVLSLKVKPQITPDDRVIMDLAVNKDSVGEIFLGIPSINTREIETQVLVDNGETVVLGGIYEQTTSNETDRVPFFGDLPGIGVLFRQTRKVDDKDELLIFVTPKILKQSFGIR